MQQKKREQKNKRKEDKENAPATPSKDHGFGDISFMGKSTVQRKSKLELEKEMLMFSKQYEV